MNPFPFFQRRVLPPLAAIAGVSLLSSSFLTNAEEIGEPKIDPPSGMIIDDDWQVVQAMCSVCHSPKLFTNYGATRQTWASLIDWMQAKQGLWPLDPTIEDKILTYLAKNYPPGEASRRRNLSADLRPPNPYISAAKAEYEAKKEKGEIPETAPVVE